MSNFEIEADTYQKAAAEVASHPERAALAHLYHGLAVLVLAASVAAFFCLPAVIWWAYSAATG
jgi:hypothetical protein